MSHLFMGAGDSLQEVRPVNVDREALRDIALRIKIQPNFLGEPLAVIAETDDFPQFAHSGQDPMLVALDVNAQVVVIELRCSGVQSDNALQSLKHVAFLSRLGAEELGKIAQAFSARPSNIGLLRSWRDREVEISEESVELSSLLATVYGRDAEDFIGIINRKQRVIVAAENFDARQQDMISWLNQNGVDIRGIQYRKYLVGGQAIFFAEQVVPKVEAAERQPVEEEAWRVRGLSYYQERLIPAMGIKLAEFMDIVRPFAFTTNWSNKYSFLIKGTRRNLRARVYLRNRLDLGFFNATPEVVNEYLHAYALGAHEAKVAGGYASSPFVHITSDTELDDRWRRLLADWLNGAPPGTTLPGSISPEA